MSSPIPGGYLPEPLPGEGPQPPHRPTLTTTSLNYHHQGGASGPYTAKQTDQRTAFIPEPTVK